MTPNRDEILDLIVRWEEAKAQGQTPSRRRCAWIARSF